MNHLLSELIVRILELADYRGIVRSRLVRTSLRLILVFRYRFLSSVASSSTWACMKRKIHRWVVFLLPNVMKPLKRTKLRVAILQH